jgi:hypothetical protein
MTKVSVFRFQFFRFISLTPETSNSAICNLKCPPFFGTICADLIGNSHDEISGLERTIGCDSVVSIRNY